jgi:hypothetical protein
VNVLCFVPVVPLLLISLLLSCIFLNEEARFVIFSLFTDVARCVLLTKIDVLCESVETDVTNTYKSEKVKQAVQRAAEFFCVQVNTYLTMKE